MRLCWISFVLSVSYASAATFLACPSSGTVDISNIKITGCSPNKRDCVFIRGEDAQMQMPFTTTTPAQNLTAVVHGILGGIPIPFPLPNNDACKDSGLTCPLGSGQTSLYTADLPVKKEYPPIHVIVQWELQDENGQDVACIKFPVRLS